MSIPTAEDILTGGFYKDEWWELMSYLNTDVTPSIIRAMRKYTTLHVEAALKAAGEKAKEIQKIDNRKYVSAKSILNAYHLENIK